MAVSWSIEQARPWRLNGEPSGQIEHGPIGLADHLDGIGHAVMVASEWNGDGWQSAERCREGETGGKSIVGILA